jgi:hypothetical protein
VLYSEEVRKSQSAVSLACFVGDSDHEPLLNNFESCILQVCMFACVVMLLLVYCYMLYTHYVHT